MGRVGRRARRRAGGVLTDARCPECQGPLALSDEAPPPSAYRTAARYSSGRPRPGVVWPLCAVRADDRGYRAHARDGPGRSGRCARRHRSRARRAWALFDRGAGDKRAAMGALAGAFHALRGGVPGVTPWIRTRSGPGSRKAPRARTSSPARTSSSSCSTGAARPDRSTRWQPSPAVIAQTEQRLSSGRASPGGHEIGARRKLRQSFGARRRYGSARPSFKQRSCSGPPPLRARAPPGVHARGARPRSPSAAPSGQADAAARAGDRTPR